MVGCIVEGYLKKISKMLKLIFLSFVGFKEFTFRDRITTKGGNIDYLYFLNHRDVYDTCNETQGCMGLLEILKNQGSYL